MKRLLAAFALLLLASDARAADPDAASLLKRAYDNYRARNSETTVQMTIHRPDWERKMQVRTWTRGEDDALVRFLSPPKDAGNATLKLRTDMWVFNPKPNQVIKLPPSMMAQSWMGSDFSYNDLAKSQDILEQYTHRLAASTKAGDRTVYTIESIPKAGAPVIWGKIVLKLRDDEVIAEQTYYDQDMKPVRRMTTEKIGALGGRPYPLVMTMRTFDEPGNFTRVETVDGKFDTAAPAHLFTLSNLQNPRN